MKLKSNARRSFLKTSGKACLGTAALLGTTQLGAMASLGASNNNDYKALVCILLAGGADSFNMLVPSDSTYYDQYRATRTDLALSQTSLLPLNNGTNNGRTLGLHPQLTGLQSLFNAGNLAFLSNVGPLVEPTSTQALANGSAKLPLGLYSHSDQISQWQTAVPDARSNTGWGGRMADILASQNMNQRISMSISASGSNEFQAGRTTDSYTIMPGDSPTPTLYARQEYGDNISNAIDRIYANTGYNNLLRRSFAKLFNVSISANQEFSAALANVQTLSTQFSADPFSQQLQVVAKTIAANQALGMRRQTFFVTYGGWDHHDEVINAMNTMLKPLNDGLVAFQGAMTELGMQDNVTTFTTSDFARTLSSNGRGSDHGWGGNAIVMGGSVNGGSVFGTYPSLALDNPLDTGRGVLMPTKSLDEYFTELALWFGVLPSQMSDILPNVNRFINVSSGEKPIGFMR